MTLWKWCDNVKRVVHIDERTTIILLFVKKNPTLVCVCVQVKCDQYWPSRGTETYGMIQVTMLDTVELATYSVRTFALYKVRTLYVYCVYAVWLYLAAKQVITHLKEKALVFCFEKSLKVLSDMPWYVNVII